MKALFFLVVTDKNELKMIPVFVRDAKEIIESSTGANILLVGLSEFEPGGHTEERD